MRELALFAGAGGGLLGGKLLGWHTVCAVEWEPYAASVLVSRQNDGLLPPFPIWDDVRTFDGRPWRGCVDVVSGGFPCQDISVAGKGAGITGERSGMWTHMARIVGEVRPRYVYVENSPALLTRGLGVVLGDLAALGYDCRWTVLGAADVGAPHQRDRLWIVGNMADPKKFQRDGRDDNAGISVEPEQVSEPRDGSRPQDVADATGQRQPPASDKSQHRTSYGIGQADQPGSKGEVLADADSTQRQGRRACVGVRAEYADIGRSGWWNAEPDVGRVANGVAARMDRLKAIGNGQVPLCAATAFELLTA